MQKLEKNSKFQMANMEEKIKITTAYNMAVQHQSSRADVLQLVGVSLLQDS